VVCSWLVCAAVADMTRGAGCLTGAGIVAALGVLAARGALRSPGHPVGYDWFESFGLAWLHHHREDLAGHAFRSPVYPWLLGTLGETPYQLTGVLLASLALALLVVATAVGMHRTAGPAAAAAGALAVAITPAVGFATRWSNLYPLLTTAVGVALVLGLATWSRPRAGTAWLAGLAAALAVAVDWRGGVAAVGLLGLSGVLWRQPRVAVALALPTLAGVGLALGLFAGELSITDQIAFQRSQAHDVLRAQAQLDAGCVDALAAGELAAGCRLSLVRLNLPQLATALPLAPWLAVVLGVVGLVPRRRAELVPLGLFVVPSCALVLVLGGAPLTLRYALLLGLPLVIASVLGVARLAAWAGRRGALFGGSVWVSALIAASISARGPHVVPQDEDPGHFAQLAPLVEAAAEALARDESLVDCTGRFVGRAWFPRVHRGPIPAVQQARLHPPQGKCSELMLGRNPEQVRWLIVGGRDGHAVSRLSGHWSESAAVDEGCGTDACRLRLLQWTGD